MWVSFSSWIWPCVQRSDWGLETGVVEMLLWQVPWRPWVQFEHCKSKNLTWPNKESELQIWKEMIFYYIVLKLRFFFSEWTILQPNSKNWKIFLCNAHISFLCCGWKAPLGVGLWMFKSIPWKEIFPFKAEIDWASSWGRDGVYYHEENQCWVPVAQWRLALSILGLINQEMILIKKEAAHQLPTQGISQTGIVNVCIYTSVSSTILLTVSVSVEIENENILVADFIL